MHITLAHAVRRPVSLLALAVTALAALALVVLGLGASSGASAPRAPERPIIVEVEGDAANGFGIFYADGTSIYPPTDSESRAECGEYDTWRARIVCRVEVRTWYRDLGDMQRTLAHVRRHG